MNALMPSPALRLLTLAFCALFSASAILAKETWYMLEADNVRICSNLSKKDLERLHRDIHYFNRSMEKLFQKKLKRIDEPIYALLVRSEFDLRPYVEDRSDQLAGIFVGRPGIEMIVARGNFRGNKDSSSVLFHEMTHSYLAPFKLKLWQNEGLAELFETVEVERNSVSVGLGNPNWIHYHTQMPKYELQDYQSFLTTTSTSDYYTDGETALNFYGRAWLFAHYCFQGKPELTRPYLELGKHWPVNEDIFVSLFGFDYNELDSRLRQYAKTGRYTYRNFKISDLPALPPANLRPATEEERITFETRAYCLTGHFAEAANLINAHAYDSQMGIENRWLLAVKNEEMDQAISIAKEAVEKGYTNPAMLGFLAYQQFRETVRWRNGRSPRLTPEEARPILFMLQPALRTAGRFPAEVRTMILVLDAAESAAPPNVLEIMDEWRRNQRRTDKEVFAAMDRIVERSTRNAIDRDHEG